MNLLGKAENKCRLFGKQFDEGKAIPVFQAAKNYSAITIIYILKLIILYMFKDCHQAFKVWELIKKHNGVFSATMYAPQCNFYFFLALLSYYPKTAETEQKQYLKQVVANQNKMKIWAKHAPMNFQNKYELVEAEKGRVLGNKLQAMEMYDRAIKGAKKQGFIQEEAIACERAAEFYFAIGREEIGRFYMKNAHYAYQRWGAAAKVADLEAEYPELPHSTASLIKTTTISISDTTTTQVLDLATVIKSTKTLSSEIVLEKLLATLMNVLVENAGAERGVLIIPYGDSLLIEATQ